MSRSRARGLTVAAWLVSSTQAAQAHIVGARLGDFYSGALHPLTAIEDLVLWLALGVLAGAQSAAQARLLVALFPVGLLFGLVAGFGLGVDATSHLIDAGLMVVLGGLLAAGPRLPGWVVGGLALALAFVRGVANVGGAGPGTDRMLFAAGFVLAGYAAITLTMAATIVFRRADKAWRLIAVRALGSWIAAIGVMLGGYALSVR